MYNVYTDMYIVYVYVYVFFMDMDVHMYMVMYVHIYIYRGATFQDTNFHRYYIQLKIGRQSYIYLFKKKIHQQINNFSVSYLFNYAIKKGLQHRFLEKACSTKDTLF